MPISAKFGRGGENSRGGGEPRKYYGNSIRWGEDTTQGLSIKTRFVLRYIYTLCGPGAARTSIITCRVVSENGFASERNIATICDDSSSCKARKKCTCNQTPGMKFHGLLSN